MKPVDQALVDQIRKQHDPDYRKISPHFTLLFGCNDVDQKAYLKHIERLAETTEAFKFKARRVTVGVDYFNSTGYAFLVVDEGNSNLHSLHDLLYSGALSAHQRLDLPYIPHITLGKCKSLQDAKTLCKSLNEEKIFISGEIASLSVVAEENGKVTQLAQYALTNYQA